MSDLPPIERVEDGLRKLGDEHEPPPDWQRRVNDAIDRSERGSHWFLVGVCVVCAIVGAAIAAWWLWW